MGPDPFSMPGFGSPSAQQNSERLAQAVGQAAPLATQWHGELQVQAPQQIFAKPIAPKSGGVLANLGHFIGGIGSEIGHISTGAATWLGRNVKAMVESPYHYAQGMSHAILDNYDINSLNAQTKQNSDTLNSLHDAFKSGRISANSYKLGLKELSREMDSLTAQHTSLDKRIQGDKQQAVQATIDTAALLTTVLTAGFGSMAGKVATARITADGLEQVAGENVAQRTGQFLKSSASNLDFATIEGTANRVATNPALSHGESLLLNKAANFLKSSAANIHFTTIEGTINKLASDPEMFARFSAPAQKAIQAATAEVVAGNTGTMTAGQIARASAANLALKYPIYYNMLSGQSQEIYAKLDNKEYGSAVQQLAINAALLLSGGPIGWALKQGGRAVGGVTGAVFGRSSFIDELSKGIGDGAPDGLFNAINKIADPVIKKEVIQNLSAVEATNLAATAGKDPIAAAWRVLNGMSSYEGMSMNQFTHDEALHNMVTFAKAQRLVDDIAKKNSLGPITVGRVDARNLNEISAQISPLIGGGNKDSAMNAWEAMKAENLQQAWANNENLDRQIKSLINRYDNPGELDAAIRGIKSQFKVKGFPEAEAKQLSKMGYIPIKPVSLEAPFREGTGQVATKFTEGNNDFFLKAVTPVPLLGSMGSLLTHLGLSPTASTSRVYQLFNQNLSESLAGNSLIHSFADKGSTNIETADNLIKRLSNYAHNPQTFTQRAAPITDLRQMTTRDIMKALPELTASDAREIKYAIMDAMIQVPLQIRGLGDKLVDLAYKINPAQKAMLRIQGGARFAWNPFFQAKLATKTEILAQAEAGGKFPTIGGMDSILSVIFPDKYEQLDGIRKTLRDAGIFDSKAARFGEGLSGEAVNDVGVAGANLTHKLLKTQERSIAGMVSVQADKLGISVEDMVKYHNTAVRDTVQMIAQYDRNSVFLNSAMARTLNLAFFPFRFEYKVASIMARSLARTNVMTQLAVINGLYRADKWLNSPEGVAWYSENSKVIQLFKYFTPVQTLGEVTHLLGMDPDSIGSFGELGGLPFGWIPTMLDAQGLTNFGGGYVSP
jgi:hypothetical protein